VAADEAEAAALALKAGLDVEMPGFACLRTGVPKALSRGLLDMAAVDAAVTRVLVEKSRLGLFEHPYAEEGDALSLGSEEHRLLAAEAAERSIVLLKNDGTLPLSGEGTTALVGPLADEQLAFFCSYSVPVHLIASLHTVDRSTRYARTLREVLGDGCRKAACCTAGAARSSRTGPPGPRYPPRSWACGLPPAP
jgi:beta-glucosidase